MNSRQITSLAALILFGAISVHATQISGFGSPASNALLSGGAVENFDSSTPGNYSSFVTSNGVTISANAQFQIGSAFIGQYNNPGTNSLYNPFTNNNGNFSLTQFRFNFASPVNAFGFNFGASNSDWTLSAYSSSNTLLDSFVLPQTWYSNSGDYFGIAAAGISYAVLTDDAGYTAGDYVFIDNLTTQGRTSTVPDAGSTLVLFSGAVVALAAIARRKSS